MNFDLIFSPGINCFDADIIAVHIVFAEYIRLAHRELSFFRNSPTLWPRLLHRKLSYALFSILEYAIYSKKKLPLIVISHKMERDLARCFNKSGNLHLLYHGIDPAHMNPLRREQIREQCRADLNIPADAFTVLIVGNDWKKKGLHCLLEAVSLLNIPALWILVRGRDESSSCEADLQRLGLGGRVRFLPPIPEVESYYSAADLYAGPSLEDSFAIPPLEAMACGLPVIVSRLAGVSELIVHGENGFILSNPRDVKELANLIRRVYYDAALRRYLSEHAALTAIKYTWQRNAEGLRGIIQAFLVQKKAHGPALEQDAFTRL